MPFTPFHFGPGALLQAVAPRQVSFLSFCATNVLIDVEALYQMVHRQQPVHAFFHTYLGATLVIVAVVLLFMAGRSLAQRFGLPKLGGWRRLTVKQVLVGAVLGAYSHVLLDSVMHEDIRPLAPFSSSNALLGVITVGELYLACLALGLLGLLVAFVRWFVMGSDERR